jgi:hypothetical protein
VRHCSPHVAAQNKEKEKANVTWKERNKRLRLPNNPVPVTDVRQRQEEGEADVDADNEADKKKHRIQHPAMWCSPSKFLDIFKLRPKEIKDDIKAKGFGGLLDFKSKNMDMKLLTWLMYKLNAEKMILDIGGGKSIPVNEHTVWCAFQIPRAGKDPPAMTDEEARPSAMS